MVVVVVVMDVRVCVCHVLTHIRACEQKPILGCMHTTKKQQQHQQQQQQQETDLTAASIIFASERDGEAVCDE